MATNDVARLGYVRRALRTLRKGVAATRNELFKDMPDGEGNKPFSRKVMNKLVACGAVRRTEIPGLMQASIYVLSSAEKLDFIMESDESISDFLWAPEKELALGPPIPTVPPKQAELALVRGVPDPNIPLFKRPTNGTTAHAVDQQRKGGPPPASSLAPAPYIPQPGEKPPEDMGTIETTNKLLAELIETMHTSLQSTIYARDAVDDIRKEIKALDAKFDKLLEAWK
jgi:hypothetical protein